MAYRGPVTSDSPTGLNADLQRYFAPGSHRGRTTEAVTDALREAILDGVLPSTTWLREDEIASIFAVSRTPVREALRRLADEGLATKTANHGTAVAPLSIEDILALYVVRENLEGLDARLAAATARPELVDRLNEIGSEMRFAAEQADVPALVRLNLDWHRALREASGNTYLGRFLNQVEHAVRRLPSSTLAQPGRAEQVLAEHDAVVRAIENGNADAAQQAASAHMHRAREIRLSVLLGV